MKVALPKSYAHAALEKGEKYYNYKDQPIVYGYFHNQQSRSL